jgi:LPS-assembly protein
MKLSFLPSLALRGKSLFQAFESFQTGAATTESHSFSLKSLCRTLITLFFLGLPASATAQLGGLTGGGGGSSFGQFPVEITSDGETRFEGGLAIAEKNVVIHYNDLAIYCDYAQYNPESHEAFVRGNVRIFRQNLYLFCDRAIYNVDTKQLRAADFGSNRQPFEFVGDNLYSPGTTNEYEVRNGSFSTSDSSKPDYQLRAKRIRIYPNDRIIFSNVSLYVGRIPVFWWPYLYQSLNNEFSLNFSPGYKGDYGAYLLTAVSFPVTKDLEGTAHLDLRTDRGAAFGLDLSYTLGTNNETFGRVKTYFLDDLDPNKNETSLARQPISAGRYRLSYQSRTYITPDLVAVIDVNKLSDQYIIQDFFPYEFQINPQPDNFVQLEQKGEAYTLTGIVRFQGNQFFETTERLPDVNWEIARTPLFNSPIFYEATTSAGFLRRAFEGGSLNPDYESFRLDTFHQFLYPKTYFEWLSLVPRVGFRATYYEHSGEFIEADPATGIDHGEVIDRGGRTRFVFNAGAEASFKLSRPYEGVQIRWLGLDGLRHIIQPYTNFSYVSDPTVKPQEILPFDRFIPSTQIPPIDFPQFNSVDSIDHWTILRLGVRNRLQTRRDNSTLNWFDIDTYFDFQFEDPFSQSHYSNIVSKIRFAPVPWLSLSVDSQFPVDNKGFTEINTYADWIITPSIEVRLGDRYLDHNPNFANSNLVTLLTYYRLNENWGLSFYEQYEAALGVLQEQQYSVHRDLSSWVASVTFYTRDNGAGKKDLGLTISFTLKDLPRFGFQVNPSPGTQ